jgi:uncharacterized membrane protein YccC
MQHATHHRADKASITSPLRDRVLASDPTLERLRSGLRAVLTAGLNAALFLLVTRLLHLPYKLALPGIVVPMIAAVALQDPEPATRKVTLVWVAPVACAVLAIGSAVADNVWLSGACFMATIFAAFQARRLGPRGAGLGTIAYQSFFFAMLFKTPPAQLGWTILFVCMGCAVGWAVQFLLVPERPSAVLRAQLRAYHARLRTLLHALAAWLDGGDASPPSKIDSQLAALRAQSLALDARLAGYATDRQAASALRDDILRCDIAVETIADVARGLGAGAEQARRLLAAQLRTVRGGGTPASDADPDLPADVRWRLARALHTLGRLAPWKATPAMAGERQPGAPPTGGDAGAGKSPTDARNGRKWVDDTTRRAAQATVAALGALVAGRALSPDHWYWAVFAGFVVFTRSVTVGQTLSGAWRQVLSAVAGLGLGMLVAELVHGNRTLELTLLFVFVGLGFYAFKGWQNVYVVLLSAMLAMLYELLGKDSAGLLLIRLGETAAGAACAVLSARFVLPVHTSDESDAKSAGLLRAVAKVLVSAARPPSPPSLHDALRDLDRKHEALRNALAPVTGTGYPAPNAGHRERLDALSQVARGARQVRALVADGAVNGTALGGELGATAEALVGWLEDMAATLEAPDPDRRLDAARPDVPLPPVPDDDVPLRAMAGLFADMGDALRRLQDASAETA